MPWKDMFASLRLTWPEDMQIVNFINLWKPEDHHYEKDGNGNFVKIDPDPAPTVMTEKETYYSPYVAEGDALKAGCIDRMTIARQWIKDLSSRMLDYSADSHIGLVDFAGAYSRSGDFTSTMADVENFLSNVYGHDNTYYHLGLDEATALIEAHYPEMLTCNNPLYIVFISDGMPDYGGVDWSSTVEDSIQKLHEATERISERTDILAQGKGLKIYAAGLCVSQTATWPSTDQTKDAAYWLSAIAGEYGDYQNCRTIEEFESYIGEIYNSAASDLTAAMTDKLGGNFEFFCDEDHPITLYNYYYDDTDEEYKKEYKRIFDLQEYIKVDQQNGTITLDIDKLRIYKEDPMDGLAGMRLDFYSKLKEEAYLDDTGGAVKEYPTNTGKATFTYFDENNALHTVEMDPPFVEILAAKRPHQPEGPVKEITETEEKNPNTGAEENLFAATATIACLCTAVLISRKYRRKKPE